MACEKDLAVKNDIVRMALRAMRTSVPALLLVSIYIGIVSILSGMEAIGAVTILIGAFASMWRLYIAAGMTAKGPQWNETQHRKFFRACEKNAAFTGCLWAFAALTCYRKLEPQNVAFYAIIVVGSISVESSFMPLLKRSFLYLVIPEVAALLSVMLTRPKDPMAYYISGMLVIFIGTLYRSASVCREATFSSIRHSLEATAAMEVAESANEAKTNFLSVLSHELRTPLFGVCASTRHLIDQLSKQPATELAIVMETLKTIDYSADHLNGLVTQILDAAANGRAHLSLNLSAIDVWPLIKDTVESHATAAREKGLRLVMSEPLPSAKEPLMMTTDPQAVRQVVYNLVNNALKFTAAGEICVSARVEGGNLVMEVGDTGPGIDPLLQERMFVPFNSVGIGTPFERLRGLGLGLSICKKICESLGGSITCSSEPGKGAIFIVKLPLTPAANIGENKSLGSNASADRPANGPGISFGERRGAIQFVDSRFGGGSKDSVDMRSSSTLVQNTTLPAGTTDPVDVLIVDDAVINREVAYRIVHAAGHSATSFSSGLDALSALATHGYGVVLLDLEMPNMSGLQMISEFRRLAPGRHEPEWIILTGHLSESVQGTARQARVFACLTKPIEPKALVSAMEAAGRVTKAGRHLHRIILEKRRLDEYINDKLFGLDFFADAVSGYSVECENRNKELALSLTRSDVPAMLRAAHGLGGYAAEVGDAGTSGACNALSALLKSVQDGKTCSPSDNWQTGVGSVLEDLVMRTSCGEAALKFYIEVKRIELATPGQNVKRAA